MSRTGGLGRPAGQAIWPVRAHYSITMGMSFPASYVGKAWLSRLMKEPKSLHRRWACYWLTGYKANSCRR